MELQICTSCPRPHAENCPDCFGFGFYGAGAIVSAARAFGDGPVPGWVKCGTCGGGPPEKAPRRAAGGAGLVAGQPA